MVARGVVMEPESASCVSLRIMLINNQVLRLFLPWRMLMESLLFAFADDQTALRASHSSDKMSRALPMRQNVSPMTFVFP